MFNYGGILIPNVIMIIILDFTDKATIKEIGTTCKYFRNLVIKRFPNIARSNIISLAVECDNCQIYMRHAQSCHYSDEYLKKALMYGSTGIANIIYNSLKKRNNHYSMNFKHSNIAAEYGHLECLKFIHRKALECLKSDNNPDLCHESDNNPYESLNSDDNPDLCIKSDNKPDECLNSDDETNVSIELDELISLLDEPVFDFHYTYMEPKENLLPWNGGTMCAAARGGNIDCLIYLHENGCHLDYQASNVAAKNGDLDCLEYCLQNGTSITWFIMNNIASRGYLDCLKCIHKYQLASSYDYSDTNREVIYLSASYGYLDCLIYAFENGFYYDKTACEVAALHGNLECLKYLIEKGCPWDKKCFASSVKLGSLKCLIYLYEQMQLIDDHEIAKTRQWDEETTSTATDWDQYECLKFALEHGCKFKNDIYKTSTGKCREYLHKNGYDLNV